MGCNRDPDLDEWRDAPLGTRQDLVCTAIFSDGRQPGAGSTIGTRMANSFGRTCRRTTYPLRSRSHEPARRSPRSRSLSKNYPSNVNVLYQAHLDKTMVQG
jgi:hypothetical protein